MEGDTEGDIEGDIKGVLWRRILYVVQVEAVFKDFPIKRAFIILLYYSYTGR